MPGRVKGGKGGVDAAGDGVGAVEVEEDVADERDLLAVALPARGEDAEELHGGRVAVDDADGRREVVRDGADGRVDEGREARPQPRVELRGVLVLAERLDAAVELLERRARVERRAGVDARDGGVDAREHRRKVVGRQRGRVKRLDRDPALHRQRCTVHRHHSPRSSCRRV